VSRGTLWGRIFHWEKKGKAEKLRRGCQTLFLLVQGNFRGKNFFYFFRIRELFSESERKRLGLSGKKFSGRLSKLNSTCPFEYLKFCGIFLLWWANSGWKKMKEFSKLWLKLGLSTRKFFRPLKIRHTAIEGYFCSSNSLE